MRLVFAGTPYVAVSSLLALLESSHEVVAVISREDAPLGRKRVLTPSPVAQAAEERGIPVLKANRLTETMAESVRALNADLGVIVAYGGMSANRYCRRRGWAGSICTSRSCRPGGEPRRCNGRSLRATP